MMSTLPSHDSRAIRRVSVALFGVAMLAACDSDRAVSPISTSATIPASSKAAVQGGVPRTILIKTFGPGGNTLLPGATYKILEDGFKVTTLVDNGPFDNDVVPGTITLKNVTGWKYYVCQTAVPAGYEIDHEPCRYLNVATLAVTEAIYYSAPFLTASWDVRDWYGVLMTPSKFALTGSRGIMKINISDDWLNDLDPRYGHVTVKLPAAGLFTLCQTMATAGHYIASPACRQVDASSGRGVWAGTFVEPEAQVPSNP